MRKNDITNEKVEAIVNPANELLGNEGGAAKIIANAGGDVNLQMTLFRWYMMNAKSIFYNMENYQQGMQWLRRLEIFHENMLYMQLGQYIIRNF